MTNTKPATWKRAKDVQPGDVIRLDEIIRVSRVETLPPPAHVPGATVRHVFTGLDLLGERRVKRTAYAEDVIDLVGDVPGGPSASRMLRTRCTLLLSSQCVEDDADVLRFDVTGGATVLDEDGEPVTLEPGMQGHAACPACLRRLPTGSVRVRPGMPNRDDARRARDAEPGFAPPEPSQEQRRAAKRAENDQKRPMRPEKR
jgi:hypothetical protein